MLSGPTLRAAETIARRVRKNSSPWGGMRVIAVGDFAQLPPVNPFSQTKEWAFLDEVWDQSEFTHDHAGRDHAKHGEKFLRVLNHIRDGAVNDEVTKFPEFTRDRSSRNFRWHAALREKRQRRSLQHAASRKSRGQIDCFQTLYSGKEREIENFKKNAPIPDVIHLKEEALVMLRQNDPGAPLGERKPGSHQRDQRGETRHPTS